ncbi:MAG: HU family DNA-binding protein [Oscillospiraceae bacterium]
MKKADLLKKIKENGDFTSSKDAENALNAVISSITETLVEGKKVQILGFGTFEVRHRNEKKATNPKTKVPYIQPAKEAPAFKAGKALKDAVNK